MNDEDRKLESSARFIRRRALLSLGPAGAAMWAGRSPAQTPTAPGRMPACVLTPAQTEGPYFVDERLNRSDVRADPANGAVKDGALFTLRLRVSAVEGSGCRPLAGAVVDIWHCDASGVYSNVDDRSFTTRGSRFLRGYQATDANGAVRFVTIYPGAYPGRAVHIHFKVRAPSAGRDVEFTSQLYFDDALTDRVHARQPYAGSRERTRNARDGLFRRGGDQLQLDVVGTEGGYAAIYDVGLKGA